MKRIAVLGHCFDETRPGGIVAKLAAQGLDALSERLVGHRHAAPDFIHEAILSDEPAGLADQQRQCIEVAAGQFDGFAATSEHAVVGIQLESRKSHFNRQRALPP
jgi:hypothetical protein